MLIEPRAAPPSFTFPPTTVNPPCVMDTTMTELHSSAHVDPDIFKHLQEKIDEEGKVRDVHNQRPPSQAKIDGYHRTLKQSSRHLRSKACDALNFTSLQQSDLSTGRITQSILSRIHNTPTPKGQRSGRGASEVG